MSACVGDKEEQSCSAALELTKVKPKEVRLNNVPGLSVHPTDRSDLS